MPTSRFGLVYELLFPGDEEWADVTAYVDSRQTVVTDIGASSSMKSAVSTCKFELRHKMHTLEAHADIVTELLTAKENGDVILFRMTGADTFYGKVDLGNFSQKNGRLPGFITIEVVDNSYLLDQKMKTGFEYPDNDDLDDLGWAVFDTSDLTNSIVAQRIIAAGYLLADIDAVNSDSITEKVRRTVYRPTDDRTYRDYIDTMLFEHCAVFTNDGSGKFVIKRLYKVSPSSARTVTASLSDEGVTTRGGNYEQDGVKLKWSTLSRMDDAMVYNANISTERDEAGELIGDEIQPEAYWPVDGDIEETWQEFDATFLDKAYHTKQSRKQNKDLSLISVKNAVYEVIKDDEVVLSIDPPTIEPLRARLLFVNSDTTTARFIKGLTILGDCLYRSKINETLCPAESVNPEDAYESEFITDNTAAVKLASHLYRFHKYGDLQHSWAEINVATPMFQIVTVAPPDSAISSLSMVVEIERTYIGYNIIRRKVKAVGLTSFATETSKTVSTMRLGKVNGADGLPGKSFSISPGSLSLSVSPRGVLSIEKYIFSAELINFTGTPTFDTTGGITLEQNEIEEGVNDPLSRIADFTAMEDIGTITATVVDGDATYTAEAVITKAATGLPTSQYVGPAYDAEDLPEVTLMGEPLIEGDWLLYLGEDVSGSYQNGYVYEWDGTSWFNQSTDKRLYMDSKTAADALEYAKSAGPIYAFSVVAELILATDITVRNKLKSANYAESSGIPTAGWLLDGPNNLIKAVNARLYAAIIDGSFTSDVLTTQDGETGAEYDAQDPADTLWNDFDLYTNFPVTSSDEFQSATGTWGAVAFDKATRLVSNYPTYYKTGGQSASVYTSNTGWDEAVEVYSYTVPSGLGPGPLWAHVNTHIDGWWTYTGVRVYRSGSVVYQASAGSGYGEFGPYVQVGDVVKCYGWRGTNIGWGVLTATVVNFRIRNTSMLSGVYGISTDRTQLVLIAEPNATKYHSASWSLTSPSFSTDSIVSKKSGTAITTEFADLSPTFIQASGTVYVEEVTLSIDRMRRLPDGSIEFGGAETTVIINAFIEGTDSGAYDVLETTAVTTITQLSGILTKNIMPTVTEEFDIGQENVATPGGLVQLLFRHLYLSGYIKLGGSLLTRGSTSDIGEAAAKFRNLYLSGAVNGATLALSSSGVIDGDLTVKGSLKEQDTTQWSLGSQSINYGASYVLPRGVYQIYRRSAGVGIFLEVKDASTWYTVGDVFTGGGYVASDGTNMRLLNNSEDTNCTVYWRKKPV